MKTKVSKLVDLTFSITSGNKALVIAIGEVPTSGWLEPELTNDRTVDRIFHSDFVGTKPTAAAAQVLTPIRAERSFLLRPQEQQLTIHSETNERSVTLPAAGDPAISR